MLTLFSNTEIRAIESKAIEAGQTAFQLMRNAGEAALQVLIDKWPDATTISVCCGKGNNAGDGLVLAALAKAKAFQVTVYNIADDNHLSDTAQQALKMCRDADVDIKPFDEHTVLEADVIVDALLGTGLKGEVGEPYAKAITAINLAECSVLSLDVPSGLNADTGEIHGLSVNAALTMTFIALKKGLFTGTAPAYAGEIKCSDLNIPESIMNSVSSDVGVLDWEYIRPLLPPKRARDSHKGDYGHVLVVGGDYGMGGAVRMAAEAALRVGAGLVTVATRPEHVTIVSGSRPELMCHQVSDPSDLDPLLARASVIVAGPGLGKSLWAQALLKRLIESGLLLLIDADGLNILSQEPQHSDHWVLTPHPGEAASLLGSTSQAVQHDRFVAVTEIQQRYGGVVALKGVGTLIKGHDPRIRLCPAGNPGMASGGMGDVLSGIIGGLMAQKLSVQCAAEVGVFIHAKAADIAASEEGERGLLATDLIPHLRPLVNLDEDYV